MAAKKRQNKIWEYRKMLQIWKKHGVMVYAGYITGFPFDTRETILRDLEILKRELAIEVVEIFYLTPLPGSEDHQRLTNEGTWMDPDMNKYSLSERVTHHTKMSDEEWEHAYHEAWKSYYNREHIERIMRRAAANGKPLNKVMWPVLWFWACHAIEGIHPVEGGYIRRKVRTERRPGFKIENPLVFYPKRAADFLWKGARWLRLLWIVRSIARKVEADPAKREIHGCGAGACRRRSRGGGRVGDDPHARRRGQRAAARAYSPARRDRTGTRAPRRGGVTAYSRRAGCGPRSAKSSIR